MPLPLVECVPNFSSGRSPELLTALEEAVHGVPGAVVLNASSDADHHRSVLTFVAPPERAAEAALAVVRVATERIDLQRHRGVHPRMGATDVLPFVPLAGCTEAECVALAHQVGARLAAELELPIFFYGAAALRPERRALPNVRRGGFEALLEKSARGESIDADLGPQTPHPSAGACAVGVRPFLIAYNINLESDDLGLARSIAKAIRESNGGLPAIRALGMWLEGPGLAQVSINLCDYQKTGLLQVFERVQQLASAAGVLLREAELIGLAPAAALDAQLARRIGLLNFDPQMQIIEQRVNALNDRIQSAPKGGR